MKTMDVFEALDEGWTFSGLLVGEAECFSNGKYCSGCAAQVIHRTDAERTSLQFTLIGARTLVPPRLRDVCPDAVCVRAQRPAGIAEAPGQSGLLRHRLETLERIYRTGRGLPLLF